jgi:putative transposase
MRIEPFGVGNYLHVYNRGTRKMEIVRDNKDKWRFIQAIRFFNDSSPSQNIVRDILSVQNKNSLVLNTDRPESVFEMGWPPDWPDKDPLVKILCYCLMPNHFHLLLKEIKEGGISKFMQKIGIGFTNYFNLKYKEKGSLFQGSYKGKVVKKQRYIEYLSVYIQVINVLELFPGGLELALKNIDEAMKFAESYIFSSYLDCLGLRNSLIIDKDVLGEIFPTPEKYRNFVREILEGKIYNNNKYKYFSRWY